jgi:hypothetical protein
MGCSASRLDDEEVIVETLSKEEIQKLQVKRTYIAKEILSTEISYVAAIAVAVNDWEVCREHLLVDRLYLISRLLSELV